MITRDKLLGYVIGMVAINDAELLDQDKLLPGEICIPGDRPAVRALRDRIEPIFRDYDYTASLDFESRVTGKSSAFAKMLHKQCNEPVKRASLRKEFREALADIFNPRVLELLPADLHDEVFNIRMILMATSNPDPAQQGGGLNGLQP